MNLPDIHPDFCIEKHIHTHRTKTRMIYILIVVAMFTGIAALPFIRVTVVIRETGIIRPICEKTVLKAAVSQTIKRVYAKEGDTVFPGDTLLTFQNNVSQKTILHKKTELIELDRELSDLQKLCNEIIPGTFHSEKREQEYRLYTRQAEELMLKLHLADQKYQRNKALFDAQVISADEFESIRYDRMQCTSALKTLNEDWKNRCKSEWNTLQIKRNELADELTVEEQTSRMHVLLAPVKGTLESFNGWYKDGFIPSGETLGYISPDSTLIVESYVSPSNIGYLYSDMPVRILVDAFNYQHWGILHANIASVSSDVSQIDNALYYKVVSRLKNTFLTNKNGQRSPIKKGMTVQCRFAANKKSLAALLFQRMDEWFNLSRNNTTYTQSR